MREAAGYLAVACLTVYQVPQLARIIRRKSAEDFSIPAYCFVVAGLAFYCLSTSGGPAFWPSVMSLANASTMLVTVLYYRGLLGRLSGKVFGREARGEEPKVELHHIDPLGPVNRPSVHEGGCCRHCYVESDCFPATDR